jgi:tetratricopeptide (TPR) repeat protein
VTGTALTRATGVTAQPTPGEIPAVQPSMPAPLADRFVGRPDTMADLSGLLVPGSVVVLVPDQPAPVAPWDWSGSRGKTQCAAHAAIHLRQSGAVDLVAWVDASSRASLLDGLASAGLAAGLDDEGGCERAAARFVEWLAGTSVRWLVVLDDVRAAADVDSLWPAGPAGITLVTARDPAVAAGRNARVVPVGCYSQREAIAALSAWLSTDPEQRSGVLDLALALDCEPAAIAHAGAVISTAELTCRSYHDLFARRRAAGEQAADCEIPAAVVTWVLSAEHAEILQPGAGTWPLLVLASLLSRRAMPAAVLASAPACDYLAVPAGRARAAADALCQAGLLALDHNGPVPAATMTAPLQATIRASAPQDLLAQAVTAAADALASSWPGGGPQSPAAMLYRSSAAALRSASGDLLLAGGRHHRLLVTAGHSQQAAGLAGPAAAWWRDLAADSTRLLGGEHEDTVAAASLAASALLRAGQAHDAVSWAGWVLTRREAALGPDHRVTVGAATVLGRALSGAGRSADAVGILADAAGRAMRVLGPTDEATVDARYELAGAFLAAGQPAQAARVLRRVLAALREPGRDDGAAWPAAERLAEACLAAGRADEAAAALGQARSGRERALGPGHPETLRTCVLLAAAHRAAGDMNAALRLYQRAQAGYRQALGAGHRGTLACAADLARAYAACGQATAAMSLLADAASEAQRVLPPGDPLAIDLLQARDGLFT